MFCNLGKLFFLFIEFDYLFFVVVFIMLLLSFYRAWRFITFSFFSKLICGLKLLNYLYTLNNTLFHFFSLFLSVLFLIACFSCLYISGSIFLTIYFKHFDFFEWFDLNSNPSNLFEISLTSDFFVEFSVCSTDQLLSLGTFL